MLIKPNIPFTMVANEVLCDPNLSGTSKALYAYLFSKPDGWQFSAERIAIEFREGRETILEKLKELETAGYLAREKNHNGRMDYRLKFQKDQNPPTVKARVEKPEGGKSQPISNTEEESNTEKKNNKEEPPTPFLQILPDNLNTPDFLRSWEEWLQYRKEIKKPLPPSTVRKQLKKLSSFGPVKAIRSIEASIENRWTGLFELQGRSPRQNFMFRDVTGRDPGE